MDFLSRVGSFCTLGFAGFPHAEGEPSAQASCMGR